MANLPYALGAELTDRRAKAGISQQALGERLGYNHNYIGQIERGEKSPTLTALMALSDAFGVHVSELIKSAEDRIPRNQIHKQ
jgi:transcriptional regulator with XRE-family HTH domain